MTFITLKYSRPGACICPSGSIHPFCPSHGVPEPSNKKRKTEAKQEEADPDYTPFGKRRKSGRRETSGPGRDTPTPKIPRSRSRHGNDQVDQGLTITPSNVARHQSTRRRWTIGDFVANRTPRFALPLERSIPPNAPSVLLPGYTFEEARNFLAGSSNIGKENTKKSWTPTSRFIFLRKKVEQAGWMRFDFLGNNWKDFRFKVYCELLVAKNGSVSFADPALTYPEAEGHGIDASILRTNRQIYREASTVLYGKNKFVATDVARLFRPNGLTSLRRRTTTLIEHISFEKSGNAAELCQESPESILQPIWNMIVQYPAFLKLRKLSLRREVVRPGDCNLLDMQTYFDKTTDVTVSARRIFNKKDIIVHTAAKLAASAALRDSGFDALHIVQDSSPDMPGLPGMLKCVIEICLSRGQEEAQNKNSVKLDLHSTIMTALEVERDGGFPGADRLHDKYVDKFEPRSMAW
ncbi:hypothetical protein PV08_08738 [Exophiala spinifera]|uniref:Uncharacterized protein n=1 Tax=Exophiala spinifera TaxID=91928 RepID=A0A0D2B4F8_9EURO|nr:uncharacterized protein PV08_08738 [Exophiala spinifera]KIW13550.1 hypothetical protein PV08_08738 [Exophiala spinifera]